MPMGRSFWLKHDSVKSGQRAAEDLVGTPRMQ